MIVAQPLWRRSLHGVELGASQRPRGPCGETSHYGKKGGIGRRGHTSHAAAHGFFPYYITYIGRPLTNIRMLALPARGLLWGKSSCCSSVSGAYS